MLRLVTGATLCNSRGFGGDVVAFDGGGGTTPRYSTSSSLKMKGDVMLREELGLSPLSVRRRV